jgi:hypothetical protein
VLACAFHLRPQPASFTPSIFVPAREGCYVGIIIIDCFWAYVSRFICKRSIVLAFHLSCNLTANFSELFTNIRPRLWIIHERILNHYNSRESNSNLPIRIGIRRIGIRIELFHFFKIRIRRIEYSNTPFTNTITRCRRRLRDKSARRRICCTYPHQVLCLTSHLLSLNFVIPEGDAGSPHQ